MGEIYTDLDSDFPYKITTMNRVQDVTLSAKPYVDLYNQYYSQGNFDRANQVINEHPELLSMMLNMKIVNQMIDEIKATQRTFRDDVEDYIFTIVKLRGNYSGATKYIKYNIVYYNLQPYMAIADDIPIGTLPTNINYWYPLAIKGEQGVSGLGLSPRGSWSDSIQYYKDDMVAYNNILWGALSDNINYLPTESSPVWLKLLAFSAEYLSYDNSISGLISTTMQDAIDELTTKYNECFTSVSNGKTLVANAITDKGVTTSSTDTFATMASNISSITTGVDTSDTTALVTDVLEGKAFYNSNLQKVNGTMSNLSSASNGDDKVSPALTTQPIYNTPDNDVKFGTWGISQNKIGLLVAPKKGYFNNTSGSGTSFMYVPQSNLANKIGLTSNKIVSGQTVCGVVGTGVAEYFNFPLTISTAQPSPIRKGHIWINSSRNASFSNIRFVDGIISDLPNSCLIFKMNFYISTRVMSEYKTLTDGNIKSFLILKNVIDLDSKWLAHFNNDLDYELFERPIVYSKVNNVLDIETAYMWDGYSSWVQLSQNGSYAVFVNSQFNTNIYNKNNDTFSYNTSFTNTGKTSTNSGLIFNCSNDGTYIQLFEKIYKRNGNSFSLYYDILDDPSYNYISGGIMSQTGQYLVLSRSQSSGSYSNLIKIYRNNGSTFVEETTLVNGLNGAYITLLNVNSNCTSIYLSWSNRAYYYIKVGSTWMQYILDSNQYSNFTFFAFTPDNKYAIIKYYSNSLYKYVIARQEINYQTGQIINTTTLYEGDTSNNISYRGIHPNGLLFISHGLTIKCIRIADGVQYNVINNSPSYSLAYPFNFDLNGTYMLVKTYNAPLYTCSISNNTVYFTIANATNIDGYYGAMLIPN